ncbi:MAG: hypothetical protein R3E86_19430 [Pseudomonadales bacterium]
MRLIERPQQHLQQKAAKRAFRQMQHKTIAERHHVGIAAGAGDQCLFTEQLPGPELCEHPAATLYPGAALAKHVTAVGRVALAQQQLAGAGRARAHGAQQPLPVGRGRPRKQRRGQKSALPRGQHQGFGRADTALGLKRLFARRRQAQQSHAGHRLDAAGAGIDRPAGAYAACLHFQHGAAGGNQTDTTLEQKIATDEAPTGLQQTATHRNPDFPHMPRQPAQAFGAERTEGFEATQLQLDHAHRLPGGPAFAKAPPSPGSVGRPPGRPSADAMPRRQPRLMARCPMSCR